MFSIGFFILFLTSFCFVVYAEIIDEDLSSGEITGRKHHKFPYKVLLFHWVHGAVIALVIIKIVLALTLVGMTSALIKMFAAIKYLFQDKEQKSAPVPHYHHSHEVQYDIPGVSDFDGYHHRRRGEELLKSQIYQNLKNRITQGYYKSSLRPNYRRNDNYGSGLRQDLSGGRDLGNDVAYLVQIEENKERQKRELREILNYDDEGIIQPRNARSAESDVDENCMKKRVCLLHARANANPIFTFQLYFIKKSGLAQYWDHDSSKTADDCIKAFPCHPGERHHEETKTEEKPAEVAKKPTTENNDNTDIGENENASKESESQESDNIVPDD